MEIPWERTIKRTNIRMKVREEDGDREEEGGMMKSRMDEEMVG